MIKKTILVLSLLFTSIANAGLITGSAEENFSNTGPNWSFSDTELFIDSGTYTNGLFTLTYNGDFDTPSGETFSVFLESFDFGRLSDGNTGNDLFDNAFNNDTTPHNSTFTVSAVVDDLTLNSILSDNSLTINFYDHTPPGDWIDWINVMDWSLSYDKATDIPEPSALFIFSLGLAGLLLSRKQKTNN